MSSSDTRQEWAATLQEILDVYWADDAPQAYRLADKAAQRYPQAADIQAITAHLILWRGKREEARRMAEQASTLDPRSAYAWASVAYIAVFEGRHEDAKAGAERALTLDDQDPWVLEQCASTYVTVGDHARSLDIISSACILYPDNDYLWGLRITILRACGKQQEADAAVVEGEQRFPDSPRVWQWRARQLFRARQLEQAADLLQRAADAMPGSAEVWGEWAMVLQALARLDEAETAAKHALDIIPCSPVALKVMADVCRRRGRAREAAKWMRQADEAIPALHYQALIRRATAAMREGAWDKTFKYSGEALAAPDLLTRQLALQIQARALLEMHRLDEAAAVLNTLQQTGYGDQAFWELKGRIHQERGDRDGAMAQFQQGLSLFPQDGTLRALLLRVLKQAGSEEEARQLVEGIFTKFPDQPAGVSALIMALTDTGYRNEAQRLLQEGQQRYPYAEDLRLFNALDKLKRGDAAGARAQIKQVGADWQHVTKKVNAASYTIERIQRLLRFFRKPRDGGEPPKYN